LHHPTLAPGELAGFFGRLEGYTGYPTTKAAAEMLWLTATRTTELLGARWEEFDLEAGLWTIPAARMKMRRDHVVPLVPRAAEILQGLEPLTRNTGFVFPNRDDSTRPASSNLLLRMWRHLGYEAGGFSPHGVRGTFSTWAHDSGYDTQHVEAQLNHVDRNASRNAYNRAQYLDQRRAMLEQWAAYLESKRSGATVIPFRRTA
jgi:integrase